jgi:hypothetical protein
MLVMKKIIQLYNSFTKKNKIFTYFLYVMIFSLLLLAVVYNIYKKLKQKTIYVGCIYSKTGTLGDASYDNYKILLDSFKFSVKKYNCDLNIIPIYNDLGEDLDNISKWVEECVKKYNIKYFFGGWRSSERQHIIPILQKYNLRLFYPLQYEGVETSKNVYYFGACPNQQLIPGLKFMFDAYYYYKDVYIIGSDYSYPQISLDLVKNFINSNKTEYNKTFVYSKLYPNDETDFTEFIQTLFNKSPNGAIIINLINGESYYTFSRQFFEMYSKRFPEIDKNLTTNQNEAIKYFSNKKLENNLKFSDRYPSISTSIVENNIKKEYSHFLEGNMYVSNFSNEIITDPIYYLNYGYPESDKDFTFLKNFYEKQNRPIGDTQYCTFLSTLFFVKTISEIIKNGENIYDPIVYEKFKLIQLYSLAGEHNFRSNNHISKIFFISECINGKLEVIYQSFKYILPSPFNILSDTKILFTVADTETINISDRLIL